MNTLYRVLAGIVLLGLAGATLAIFNDSFFSDKGEILFERPMSSPEKREIELRFFGYKADSLNLVAIENILKQFMNENDGINIFYESRKGPPFWTALEKRAGNNLLDEIFMIDHDHLLAYGREGKLGNLSGIKGLDGFKKWVRQQFTEPDGSVLFLPTCISTYVLWVNYDLLKKHGFSAPATWSDFEKICDQFVAEGITPIIANNFQALPYVAASLALFPFHREDRSAEIINKFNSGELDVLEALRPGLESIEMMIRRGWIDPADTLETYQTSNDLIKFARGDRPFMISGGWASPRIAALRPAFDWGAHPLPLMPDGGVVPVEVNTCFAINADSPHQEALRYFAEFLVRPEIMWHYAESQSSFSPIKDSKWPSDKRVAPLIEAIANERIVIMPDYRLEMPLRAAMVKGCEQILNGKSVDEVLAPMRSILKREKER